MKSITRKYPQLSKLLDQLCEQTLDQTGADQLSEIVQNDPAAREYYVRYLEIHTSLFWDIAIPTISKSDSSNDTKSRKLSKRRKSKRRSSSRKSSRQEARLKNLVDRLVCDATFESALMLTNSPSENETINRSLSDRFRFAGISRRQVLSLVSVLCLFLMTLTGFWVMQHQTQIVAIISPQSNSTDNEVVNKDATGLINQSVTERNNELPPKLPNIKWRHNSVTDSKSRSANDYVSSPETNDENIVRAFNDDHQVIAVINDQISRGWEDQSLSPSPLANDSQWVRRIYLGEYFCY